jgi:hypothetical protein
MEQKALRVDMSGELLRILSIESHRQWHEIVTLDESWFYWCSDHDLMWMRPGETIPDRERYTIQSPKCRVTIVWNPSGFHVVDALPKADKFNAYDDVDDILTAILLWRGGREELDRVSCGFMRTMLGHTSQKYQPTLWLPVG